MCLIVFAFDPISESPLTLAANRDEFFARETLKAHFWEDLPGIIAGRDLKAGGTWLGVHSNGRIAFLTNFRDPKYFKESEKSRGELITKYLSEGQSESDFIKYLKSCKGQYNGYNLVFGSPKVQMNYYSNVSDEFTILEKGIYGLSNALLNTPWPKVEKTKFEFQKNLSGENSMENYLNILRNREEAKENQLPNTGLEIEMEKKLSASFIRMENYGTRCSTFLKVGSDKVNFIERTYEFDPKNFYDTKFEIEI